MVGARAVIATRASVTVDVRRGRRRQSRRRPRSPSAGGTRAGRTRCPFPGAGAGTSTETSSSSRAGDRRAGAGEELVDGHGARAGRRRSATVAPRQISGPPVSIAGEAFITFPPIVPCARVACEPTIALASARAVKRSRIVGVRGDLGVRRERAEDGGRPPSSSIAWSSASGGSRRARRGAAPCPAARRRRGRCRPRPAARRRRAPRAPRRGWWRSRTLVTPAAASQTRSGRHRQLADALADHLRDRVRDRARRRDARRLADALRALRAGVRRVRLDPVDLDLRRVGGGDELVVEEVRVPLPAEVVELRALGERLPDAHHDAAVDLAVGADAVQDPAAVVHRGDPQHAHDAGLAVDLDVRRVRDQLRRVERLEAEASDAALGRRGRRRREPRRRPSRGTSPPAARRGDRHRLLGRALDADRAADELEVAAAPPRAARMPRRAAARAPRPRRRARRARC